MVLGLALALGEWQTGGMPKKEPPKPKKGSTKWKPREDANQIAFGVMQEVIRRSESLGFGILQNINRKRLAIT
jgi:hypothetical protein